VDGAHDANLQPAVVDQHKALLANAQVQVMPNVGHAPFWDEAAAFNEHLPAFCERLELARVS
jgi:pimeloyl-ACP methyl ester carboxylesterase